MYIFKNAFVNIWRNKGRNILIAIIVMVIASACAITLSIRNSATKIVTAYENKYNVEASISMNREALMKSFKKDGSSQEEMIEKFNNIEQVSVEEINKYGDSEYVSSYYYVYSINMNAKTIKEATDSLVKETTTTITKTRTFGGAMPPGGFGMPPQNKSSKTTTTTKKTEKIYNEKASSGAFTLKGYSSYEAMTDFISGNYTITDGEVSNDFTANTCIISEELATLNSLSVGDYITFVDPNNTKLTYKLQITGIYKENSETSKDMSSMFSNSANTIITNSTVIENILTKDSKLNPTITPTFILKDASVAEDFAKEVEEKGLSEYYTITNNLEDVENATKSITNVKTFATTFLVITLIIGGVVLLVINMINIRERKYEIGVLRTVGMKKTLVISQFVIELLVVAIFGLLIGSGIGASTSVNVANRLLANEIQNSNSEFENINKNFGGGMVKPPEIESTKETKEDTKEETTEEKTEETKEEQTSKDYKINGLVNIDQIDSINAVVDFNVLLQLLAIGLGLTIFSSISACIAIARFSPLTILKERS